MINRFAQWGGMPQQNFDFQSQPPNAGPDVWNPYPTAQNAQMRGMPQAMPPQPMPQAIPQAVPQSMAPQQRMRRGPGPAMATRQPASLAAVLGGNQPQAMPALSKPQFQQTQNQNTQQAQTYANTLQNLLQGGYNPGF